MTEILFVSVPGGRIVAGQATLRVVVVPRLTGPWAQAGMADWAKDVAAAQLVAERLIGGAVQPLALTRVSVPDVDLWRTTFRASTLLRPFAAASYQQPAVQPTAADREAVATTYESSAQAVAGIRPGTGGNPPPTGDEEIRHQLGQWRGRAAPVVPPAPTAPFVEPDFHQTVAQLREHPAVLLSLGLILELTVPAAGLTLGGQGGTIRVRWPANPLVVSPQTAYEIANGMFVPASDGDIVSGMVDLGQPHWATSTVDVDGAVARLQAAAETVALGGRASLPTLRSAGVALQRKNRAEVFERRRTVVPPTAASVYHAEQLVLGYRVDVREAGGEWRSLSKRRASYSLNGQPVVTEAPEEGHIKANALTSNGPGGALQADETVARWSGWSLVVPRPTPGSRSAATGPAVPLDVDFRFQLEAEPGTLLSLRFSHSYKLRARVADLAGGGHTLDDPDGDSFATGLTTYRRFEPVGAPLVDPGPADQGPGGTADTIVLRSDRLVSVADFAAQHPQYPPVADRTLTAPQVPLSIAEQHGALDGTDEDGFALVSRALSNGSLPDPAAQGVVLFVRDEPGGVAAGATVDRSWSGSWPDLAAKAVRLAEHTEGAPMLELAGEVAIVRLPPGRQLTLEVSSLIEPNHVDHFEISHWLRDATGPVISSGRHPMATPARLLHLVHAIRTPLTNPSGTFTADRSPGDTGAVLRPSTPRLGVDPPSTVQLDVSAVWDEWGDHPVPVPSTDVLLPVTIGPGAIELPTLRHEFGNTKHRLITYTATAVSRFRHFFDATDPDEAFVAATPLAQISVLSTARPPRPLVLSVAPSFSWSGTDVTAGWTQLKRVRRSGRLRVELDRPWFATGEGESLAVILLAGPGLPTRGQLVTRAGRDPIRSTPNVTGLPGPDLFSETSGPVLSSGNTVALPYAVWFADGRWYADIAAPGIAAESYGPFVRLALARCQPESLPGLQLSESVAAEPVQLLPDRTLALSRQPGSVTVQLTGLGPDGAVNMVEVTVERSDGPSAQFSRLADAGDGPGWSRVAVAGGALGTEVTVPLPANPSGAAERLVVREFEAHTTDKPATGDHRELNQRTIFVDIIALI